MEVAVLAVVLGGFSMAVEAANGGRYIYEQDSAYNHIRVFETKRGGRPVRVMSVADFFDSGMYLDSDELVFEYTKYYALDKVFGGAIKRAAMFGGAAYSVPKDFLKRNSAGVIDVVEIDPETTEVAKKYFKLEDDPRMNIIHNDARIFLNEETKAGKNKYDTIYNDAFSSACAVPAHLTTEEAVEEVYELLDEDGVYIVNTISALEGEKSTFFRAEYKTISEVFDGVYVFHTEESGYSADDVQNIMIVATKNKEGIEQIGKRFRGNGGDEKTGKLLENYWGKEIKTDDVQILTDDFSPVSYYAAAACSVD